MKNGNPIGYTRTRKDAITNTATGLGTSKGREHYSYFQRPGLTEATGALDEIFAADGLASRIVELIPEEAARVGFTLEGVPEGFDAPAFESACEDLRLMPTLCAAAIWARLFGGGAVLVFGGGRMDQPFRRGARVEALLDVSRVDLARDSATLGDAGQMARGRYVPEFYTYTDPDSGDSKRVHHSRVVRLIGARCSPRVRASQDGWGLSVLERPYAAIVRLAEAMGYTGEMLHTASTMILQIEGFAKAIAAGGQDADEMRQAVEEVFDSVDVLHGYAIDRNHDLREVSRSFAGISSALDHLIAAAVRASGGVPKTILLGEQPAALNAGAEGEFAAWRAVVSAWLEAELTPAVAYLSDLILAAMLGPGAPAKFHVAWADLSSPDPQAAAAAAVAQAQVDQIYISLGVIDPHEVRERLILSGELVPVEAPELPEDPEVPEGFGDPEAEPEPEGVAEVAPEGEPEAELEAEPEAEAEILPADEDAEGEAEG